MPTPASRPNEHHDWATVCRWIDENRPDLAAALAASAAPRTNLEQLRSPQGDEDGVALRAGVA